MKSKIMNTCNENLYNKITDLQNISDKKLFWSIFLKKVNEIYNRKDFVPPSYIIVNYTPKKYRKERTEERI